jgi:hypothetical protein
MFENSGTKHTNPCSISEDNNTLSWKDTRRKKEAVRPKAAKVVASGLMPDSLVCALVVSHRNI